MPDFQGRYGTGSNGKTGNSNIYSWGPKLTPAAQTGYEPDDFFDTGAVYTNSITLSTGTDKNQTFFSAAAVNSAGMVPNNRYNRYNFTFRNTTSFLNDKMKLDVSASYILQNDRIMSLRTTVSQRITTACIEFTFIFAMSIVDADTPCHVQPVKNLVTQTCRSHITFLVVQTEITVSNPVRILHTEVTFALWPELYTDRLVLSVILIRVFLLILLTRMMPISKTGNRRRIIPLVNYTPNVPTRGR